MTWRDSIQVDEAPELPGLTFRRFRGETDFAAMVAVIEGSKEIDGLESADTVDDIARAHQNLVNGKEWPMKIALFYYDGFSEFEVVLIGLFFKRHEVISVALEKREYISEECQRFCVDQVIQEVDVETIDLLVIPGGDPAPLVENRELRSFIEDLLRRNKKVAGICGGSILLAGMGLLKGKQCTGMSSGVDPRLRDYYDYYSEAMVLDDHVVVDGNLITAQGQAYVEFAAELVRQMGLFKREEEYDEVVRWFRNIRPTL